MHAALPGTRHALISLVYPAVGFGAVLLLAKVLFYPIEASTRALGVAQPAALVGAVVAALFLLPESAAAIQSARRDQLQTSFRLALGSVLATSSLTSPAVGAVTVRFGEPLVLGLSAKERVLLALTFAVSILTLGGGRTMVRRGAVHLAILAVWTCLLVMP